MFVFWFRGLIITCTIGCLIANNLLYQCVIWGDPHVTRFPSSTTDNPGEVWCQDSGLQWIIQNKYIMGSMVVSGNPYIILDFNFAFFNDDGILMCTINTNQFSSPAINCSADMVVNIQPDMIAVQYESVDFSLLIRRTGWISAYSNVYYSIYIWQSLCMIRMSDGLCKRGCDPNTGHRLGGSVPVTSLDNTVSNVVSNRAAEICQIYIDNFLRYLSTDLSHTHIENIRRACINDVTISGDTQFAQASVSVLAIQTVARSNMTTQDIETAIRDRLTEVLSVVNRTNENAASEVIQIINQVMNDTVLLQTSTFNNDAYCLSTYTTVSSYSYLSAYAHANYITGCGLTYGRSLFTLEELDRIPSNVSNTLTVILKLFGASITEIADPFHAYGGEEFTNQAVLRRVTVPWSSTNLTWTSQPTATTVNQVIIPATNLRELYNVTLNITQLAWDILNTGPGKNYGLQLSMIIEARYRVVSFCSNRHVDIHRRPKLIINY